MAAFLSGSGVPQDSFGTNGDDYYNILTGGVYEKTAGEWLPKFTESSGNFFRAGAGVPDNALGIDDDYYANRINSDLYKKIAGVWVLVWRKGGSTAYYSGIGAPTFPAGNGDHYLNQSTGDVYQFVSGSWSLVYSPGSGGTAPVEISTSASTYSYNLAGKWLVGWEVTSDATQTPKLGTTPGGNEMGEGSTAPGGVWVGQGNMTDTFGTNTIYFSGLSGNNEIKLWVLG